jgi:hypothetical protein
MVSAGEKEKAHDGRSRLKTVVNSFAGIILYHSALTVCGVSRVIMIALTVVKKEYHWILKGSNN